MCLWRERKENYGQREVIWDIFEGMLYNEPEVKWMAKFSK
jgi:hypothetical protein